MSQKSVLNKFRPINFVTLKPQIKRKNFCNDFIVQHVYLILGSFIWFYLLLFDESYFGFDYFE